MEEDTAWQQFNQTATLTGDKDSSLYYACKRVMDVILATVLLLLLLPLMVLISILIKLDTPGPIIFKQERVGSRRRPNGQGTIWEVRNFCFYKFRSMLQNADPALHEAYIQAYVEGHVESSDTSQSKFKLSDDPRVTRVGRILRETSMDELPQLIHVLRGEMSLVGPRPVPEYEVAAYREVWHYGRLAALPGITGLWQVKGRGQVPFEEMIRLDLEYVRHQSLWLDIKILFLTIPTVLSRRGAE